MAVATAFPDAFRETLHQVVRRAPRMRGARDQEPRARRRALGQTGLFAGHRAYSLGDDLRLLDWNAYARSGELFVKMLEEEDRRSLTLLMDVSPSMTVGDRFVGAQRLGAVLGSLALAHLDGVHLANGVEPPRVFEGNASRLRLLDWLEAQQPTDAVSPERALATLERRTAGRVLWLSDFAEPEPFATALSMLRRRGRPCVGWLPAIPEDRGVDIGGWLRLRDPETGAAQPVQVDAPLRRALAHELETLARHQDAVFRGAGFPLVRFDLPAVDDYRPAAWLEATWRTFS